MTNRTVLNEYFWKLIDANWFPSCVYTKFSRQWTGGLGAGGGGRPCTVPERRREDILMYIYAYTHWKYCICVIQFVVPVARSSVPPSPLPFTPYTPPPKGTIELSTPYKIRFCSPVKSFLLDRPRSCKY